MDERNQFKMPFFLAYQHDTTIIPSDFTITSLLRIKPRGIFEKSFQMDFLFACGTQQGPILIAGFSNSNKTPQFISLLNGHSYSITDIQESLNGDKFISISSDSTICIWSMFDASCLMKSQLHLEKGDYHISLCPSDPSLIWIWSVGNSVHAFNIDTADILYCLPIDGLRNFSAVSEHSSCSVSDSLVVAYTVSDIISFTIDHDCTLNYHNKWPSPDILTLSIFIGQRGIILYGKSDGTWSLVRLPKIDPVISDRFDLDEDDSIFGVDWHENNTICFATYKCRFLLVKLKRSVNPSTKMPTMTISSKILLKYDSFLTSFSFLSDDTVIFVPANKHSAVILSDKEYLVLHEKSTRYQFDLIDQDYEKPCVLYANEKSFLSFYNVRTHMSSCQRYKFDGKITSLLARNTSITNSLQIVCGFEDGRVVFWYFGMDINSLIFVHALDSAIIAFVEPPLKLSGRQVLLAIGHGCCCLFKSCELHLKYNLDLAFRINAIYIILESLLFVFELSNGIFVVFNTTQPHSIGHLSYLPLNAILIYSYCSSSPISRDLSLAWNKVGSRTIWFQLFNIVNLHETENNNEKKKCAIEMLDNICVSMNENKEQNNSFVIMGHDNVASFFYYPFSLNFSNFLNASPPVAANFYIIKQLIYRMLNKTDSKITEEDETKIVNFLPILTKILYKSDDLEVQKICANICTSLSSCISFNQSQVFISPFVQNERYKDACLFENHDLLLISMLSSHFPHIVPYELFPHLYHFLCFQQTLSDEYHPNSHAAMASYVLIDGITNWMNFFKSNGSKRMVSSSSFSELEEYFMDHAKPKRKGKSIESQKGLFISIIKSVLINQWEFPFLYDRFLRYIYSEDMALFVDILPDFLQKAAPSQHNQAISASEMSNLQSSSNTLLESSSEKLGYLALDLYSEIELKNPKVVWGRMSSAIALNGIQFPEYAQASQVLLEKHAKQLNYIDMKENVILIGSGSGHIYGITGSKKSINEKLFSEGINFVSIGPHGKYGLAISNFHLTCKIFQIKPSFKITQSMKIEAPPKTMGFSIRWLCDNNATIYFAQPEPQD